MTRRARGLSSFGAMTLLAGAIGCTPAPSPTPTAGPPASLSPAPIETPTATQAADAWKATGGMAEARVGATSTVLRDGRVLVVGGFADGEANHPRASAEIYDP